MKTLSRFAAFALLLASTAATAGNITTASLGTLLNSQPTYLAGTFYLAIYQVNFDTPATGQVTISGLLTSASGVSTFGGTAAAPVVSSTGGGNVNITFYLADSNNGGALANASCVNMAMAALTNSATASFVFTAANSPGYQSFTFLQFLTQLNLTSATPSGSVNCGLAYR